ncbi:MAG TPA: rhomboid family intramembrane serine protease [Acetobacteraceae bacterium]|nr:rhomboid family intramembrane serine protease [Acetobacteraceae bacterium]
MFNRRTTGSVVCPSCGSLVGVRDDKCYSCGRSNPGLWGFGPALRRLGADFSFTKLVIGACVTLWVGTLLMSGASIGGGGGLLSALSPSSTVLILFGASGAYPVFALGRWWTVLSAGWLHAGLLHIGMNMYWLWQMGPALTDLFGPARTVIIYTAGGVAGFTLSSVAGAYLPNLPFLRAAGLTVGASAPLFGMIGALYHYGRTGSSIARQMAVSIMIQALIFGLLVPGIDNYAHLGGFAGGYFTSAFLNPMTRERGDHMIVAVACLAATALSIAASFLILFR